jgi:DNA-binding XRE family transcriptional regulator
MDRVALPFLQVPVTSLIPLKSIELGEDTPVGLHVRKKRTELRLLQKDVANIVGVSEDCITFWENGRSKPQIQHMPKVIRFLGYNPVEGESETLGGRIRNYRVENGLSHEKLGKLLGIDPSRICAWEKGQSQPRNATLMMIEELLQGDP